MAMNGVEVHFAGNLTRKPELRFAASGTPWVTFSVAVNKYKGGGRGGERDEVTTFVNCKAFRDMAEHIGELDKGDRVVVVGTVETESWNDKEGNPRESQVVVCDEVAVSLRWARVAGIERAGRASNGSRGAGASGGYGGGGGYGSNSRPAPSVAAEDAGHDPFGIPSGADGDESPF